MGGSRCGRFSHRGYHPYTVSVAAVDVLSITPRFMTGFSCSLFLLVLLLITRLRGRKYNIMYERDSIEYETFCVGIKDLVYSISETVIRSDLMTQKRFVPDSDFASLQTLFGTHKK